MSPGHAFELPPLEAPVRAAPAPEPARQPPAPPVDHIAVAVAEAGAIREQARAKGFAAGMEAGRAELLPAAHALAVATGGVEELRGGIADGVERAAVALGLRVAEQALGAALAVEPERVLDAVRGALRRLAERERVTILVNPADLDVVRDSVADIVGQLGGIEACEVQAERRMTRGGAVVRTPEGDVDATVETKLARAREVLERELADGG